MVPPLDDGRSPAPIDRPVLAFLQLRLARIQQVERADISDASGHLELRVIFASAYYPDTVEEATLSVRWYTNDDFKIHYQEEHQDAVWKCRWDRYPNPHNTRDHFHPPPNTRTRGEDAAWPADHRGVLQFQLDEIEERIMHIWAREP